jgi:predicted enzyme related to lactoylglutathione lyase
MAAVTGIGGFFIRARNPDALNRWYAEHFGVVMIESSDNDDPGWFQDRGETVFAAFTEGSDSFGAPEKTWKINFRVSDLDGMIDQLHSAGVTVEPHAEALPQRALRRARGS